MIAEIQEPLQQAFRARERIPLDEWARRNIKVGAWSPWEGDFTTDRTPWIVEPLRRLSLSGGRRVSLVGPAGGGKSTVGECFMAWIVDHSPGGFVWYCQDEDAAKEFAETRLHRFLESCDSVSKWFPKSRHMKRTQAIHFPHMSMLFQGANKGNAQSKHVPYIVKDETHLWAPGMSSAMDMRTKKFAHKRKIIELSTGSLKGDETDQSFLSGTREEWRFLCTSCKTLHIPKWSVERDKPGGVIWDPKAKRDDRTWSESRVAETVRYQCPVCAEQFLPTEANGYLLNRDGDYTQTNPEPAPNHDSFHWNCIASDFPQLATVALQFLRAKAALKRGSIEPLKDFTQKQLAEAWEDELPSFEYTTTAGGYKMADAWPDEARRFLLVDVQRDHFWVLVLLWSKAGEMRLAHYGRVSTWGDVADLQEAKGVPADQVMVDSGYNSNEVYRECVKVGWKAVKGEKAERGYTYTDTTGKKRARAWAKGTPQDGWSGTREAGRKWCQLILVSETMTSNMLELFRSGKAKGFSMPDDAPEEFKKQFAAKVKVQRKHAITGADIWEWRTVGKCGEHAWDLMRIGLVCGMASGFLRGAEATTETKGDEQNGTV